MEGDVSELMQAFRGRVSSAAWTADNARDYRSLATVPEEEKKIADADEAERAADLIRFVLLNHGPLMAELEAHLGGPPVVVDDTDTVPGN